MPISFRRPRRSFQLLLAGLLLLSLRPLGAETVPEQVKEQLQYARAPIFIERSKTVTPQDLGLPFISGVKLVSGFLYRVTDEKDQLLNYYATAQLTSAAAPEEVAQAYSRQLPGHPQPELLKDKQGARWVLAIGSEKETRSVTIRPAKHGSSIELIRATQAIEPTQPPEEERPRPRGPRGPRGPRNEPGGGLNV